MRQYREDRGVLTPSGAERCDRQKFLKAEHPYLLQIDKLWLPSMGTAIHAWLEGDDDHHELFLKSEVTVDIDGEPVTVPVQGTIDHYDEDHKRITDYKTVSSFQYYDAERNKRVPRKFPEPHHVVQVNLYAWLARQNGYEVESAQIWYARLERSATRRMVPVELWKPQHAELALVEYAEPIARALHTGDLPPALPPDSFDCRFCPLAIQAICRDLEAEGK